MKFFGCLVPIVGGLLVSPVFGSCDTNCNNGHWCADTMCNLYNDCAAQLHQRSQCTCTCTAGQCAGYITAEACREHITRQECLDQHDSLKINPLNPTRKRKLQVALDATTRDQIQAECGDQTYMIYGLVESDATHLDIVAVPQDSNNEECRQSLVFDDYDTGDLLVSYVTDLHFPPNWMESAYKFGQDFSLNGIMAAANTAPIVNPEEYDLLTNNCGSFIIGMLNGLGIEITHEVQHYVVNSMVHNSVLVHAVRTHPAAADMIPNEGELMVDLTDRQVIWRLVSNYASSHDEL